MTNPLWKGDYISGRWTGADPTATRWLNEDPGDLDNPVGEFGMRTGSVDEAVQSAQEAFAAWRGLSLDERFNYLRILRAELERCRDELALAVTRDVGKPLWEAKQEVGAVIAKVDVTLDIATDLLKRQGPSEAIYYTWEPVGVMAVLGPFNFPVHLANGQIIAALAAGCTVIFKPSERAPWAGQVYADAFENAGLPAGVFNMVQGDGRVGAALVDHGGTNGVNFTGSLGIGLEILRTTAKDPGKLVSLEMGGKNAVIVLDDADVEHAARQIALGAFQTTGQRCTSTSRVFAQRGVAAALVQQVSQIAAGLKIGHGLGSGVFCGPLVTKRAQSTFLAAQAEHTSRQRIVGGQQLDLTPRGHYVSPAVHEATFDLSDLHQTAELFGPDVVICAVDSLDEAIAHTNATKFGLAASLFSQSESAWEQARREISVGIVNLNRATTRASGLLPFGGVSGSGNFRPAGAFALRNAIFPKATLVGGSDEFTAPPGWNGNRSE